MKLLATLLFTALIGSAAFAQTTTKPAAAKNAATKDEKIAPKISSDPFIPSASDLRDDSQAESSEQKINDLKDKRWIKQEDVQKPEGSAPAKSNVTATVFCKDKSGTEFKSTDSGYDACMNEMKMEQSRSNSQAVDGDDKEKSKSATGVGFQYKFGK